AAERLSVRVGPKHKFLPTRSCEPSRMNLPICGLLRHARLSIPAAKASLKSMGYAWEAQQIILEAGNSLQPALELDARSYRAIACVLLGDKKTEAEAEAVEHLHWSWPLWKKVLDGMDAAAARGRCIVSNPCSSEYEAAGYPPTSFENAVGILVGRDTGRTPTIPTRAIMRLVRQKAPKKKHHHQPVGRGPSDSFDKPSESAGKSPAEWAARIHATRDTQEA
ncbi:hypothetical protein V502_08002, partial [Pseudogymnoascus sp. VKM F-4520 (FW-2644)]